MLRFLVVLLIAASLLGMSVQVFLNTSVLITENKLKRQILMDSIGK